MNPNVDAVQDWMRCAEVIGLLLVASAGVVPELAVGASWCVDASGTVADWSSCGVSACTDTLVYSSVQDALNAAVASAEGPSAVHQLCVMTPGAHTETVVLDDSPGAIGAGLTLEFHSGSTPNWCPDAATAEEQAGFSFIGSAALPQTVTVHQLRTSAAGCAASRPTISSSAFAVELIAARIIGTSGPVLLVGGGPGTPPETSITSSRIEGIDGPVLSADTDLTIGWSEISASSSTVGEPLIEVTGGAAHLTLQNSALFGNVVDGAPLVETHGTFQAIESVISANVVLGDADLIFASATDLSLSRGAALTQVVMSRNTLLSDGSAIAPEIIPRFAGIPSASQFCLPIGAEQVGFAERPAPSSSGTPGAGALVHVEGGPIAVRGFLPVGV